MALQTVNLGTYANDGTGDDLRTAFEKVNANATLLSNIIVKDGANLDTGVPVYAGLTPNVEIGQTLQFRSLKAGNDITITYDGTSITITDAPSINALIEDLDPKLGNHLDLNSFNITGIGNIDIAGTVSATSVASTFLGNLTGDVTGNVTGDVTGTLVGDVVGNVLGNTNGLHTGNVVGNVTGNVTGNVIGNTNGVHTGNVLGNVTGNVLGDVTGNLIGNVTGVVTGNVIGVVSDLSNHNLVSLGDVNYSPGSILPGQALVWTGAMWTNGTVSGGSGGSGSGPGTNAGVEIDMGSFLTPYELPFDLGSLTAPNSVLNIDGNPSSALLLEGLKLEDTKFTSVNSAVNIILASDTTFETSIDVAGTAQVAKVKISTNVIETFANNDDLILLANGTGKITLGPVTMPAADGTSGQVLTTNGSGQLVWAAPTAGSLGNISVTGSTLTTTDPNITFTPATQFSNSVQVTGTVTAGSFVSTNAGAPTISSATNLTLEAAGEVVISSGPLRMARFTTAERDALLGQNGDTIYNTTTNKFQGYANGVWVDLH